MEGRNGEIHLCCGEKKVSHCEKLAENYPLKRWFFFFPCPACLHLHFWVFCPLHFPAWFLCIGHHLQMCVLPWCLRNSADRDSWQPHESQSSWLGHTGYNSPKTPLGNRNAGESVTFFLAGWHPKMPLSLSSAQTVSLQVHQLFLFPRALHGFVFWCTADTVCHTHFSTVSKSL